MIVKIEPNQASGQSAFDRARATCDYWGVRKFWPDLVDHLRNGVVISMPHLFLMMKAVALPDGRAAWLITHAVGELALLVQLAPFPLEWVALRRRLDQRLRIYSSARLTHLAIQLRDRRNPATR